LALGLGAAAVAGTALVNWSLRKSARVRPIAWLNSLLVLGAAFLGLFLAAVSGFARFGATTFDDERFLVAGVTYRVGHRGTWDPDDLIGREVRTDLTRTWIEVVASRNSEDMHALMFGSGEETTGASRFRSDAAGRVHVLDGPCCLVAFDPQATRPRSRAGSSRDTNLGIAPEDVSPFSLLGPDERGAASVADRLAGIIADRRACLLARRNKLSPPPGGDWAPSEAALLPALDSPNAWVRETAARFIREGGATLYPEAVRRVPK
jgi:hypothetical protein